MDAKTNFDMLWKDVLEALFSDFMELFFKEAHREIDWRVKPKFLDKEMRQVTPESSIKNKVVDLLAEVRLKSGENKWISVHIEI